MKTLLSIAEWEDTPESIRKIPQKDRKRWKELEKGVKWCQTFSQFVESLLLPIGSLCWHALISDSFWSFYHNVRERWGFFWAFDPGSMERCETVSDVFSVLQNLCCCPLDHFVDMYWFLIASDPFTIMSGKGEGFSEPLTQAAWKGVKRYQTFSQFCRVFAAAHWITLLTCIDFW